MRISLDTETEEIAELRHAIAILGDAIKRRESPEEETEEEVQEETPEEEIQEEIPETPKIPEQPIQKLSEPIKIPEPQIQQRMPEPQMQQRPVPQRPYTPPRYDPKTDILSKFASSDYGNKVEKRTMSGEKGSGGFSQSTYSAPPSRPSSMPQQPQRDNKSVVKGLIETLKMRSGGNPIMMQDIVKLARDKNIREDETRNLVNELQRSGAI